MTDESSQMLLDILEQTKVILNQEKDINRTIVSNLINIVSNELLTELGQILKLAAKAPILIDPSLARGLSYYTGAIMEINVPDLAGSLGGGGRYDGLIGMFGKEKIPACGFSLGLERILVVMDERNMFPAEVVSTSVDVMVTIWNEESIGESLKLANDLRQQGLRVLLYPEADKLGKQLKYASQLNIPYVCVLGESELAVNQVTLKNMQTGEQETLPRAEIAAKILPSK
jgi:histidyl-tRNA synthetase